MKNIFLFGILFIFFSILIISCSSPTSSGDNGGGNGEVPIIKSVTISPSSANVLPGDTQAFTATVNGSGNPIQTVSWSVEGGNSGTNISSNGLLSVSRDETALTLSVRATSLADSTKSGTVSVLVGEPTIWEVADLTTWADAHQGIMNSGHNKLHIITVSGHVVIPPSSGNVNTFGTLYNLTLIIQGDGILSTSRYGRMFSIGSNQTIILRDITLQGRNDNNGSVVEVKTGGTFRMEGYSKISDNTVNHSSTSLRDAGGVYIAGGSFIMQDNSEMSYNNINASGSGTETGGGVYVGGRFTLKDNASIKYNTNRSSGGGVKVSNNGIFNMEGGLISNNTAYLGGGVDIVGAGSFTMHEGTIAHNTVTTRGGGVCGNFIMHGGYILGNTAIGTTITYITTRGGGVDATRNFIKTGGTIYSNYDEEGLRNIAIGGIGHSIYQPTSGSADSWRNATTGPLDFSDRLDFWLNEIDITYEVTHNNWPPTSLTFTFSEDPGEIQVDDITFCDNVSKGSATITGNGNTRILSPVTISGNGIIDVTILSVYKISTETQKVYFVPPAPTGVSFLPSASTVLINYDQLPFITGYKIYRGSNAFGPILIATNSSNYYVNTNLSHSTTYSYRISAFNSAGESPLTQLTNVTTFPNTDTIAIPVSNSSIVYEWAWESGNSSFWDGLFAVFNTLISELTAGLINLGSIETFNVIERRKVGDPWVEIQQIEWRADAVSALVAFLFGYAGPPNNLGIDHFYVDSNLNAATQYEYRTFIVTKYRTISGENKSVSDGPKYHASTSTYPNSIKR